MPVSYTSHLSFTVFPSRPFTMSALATITRGYYTVRMAKSFDLEGVTNLIQENTFALKVSVNAKILRSFLVIWDEKRKRIIGAVKLGLFEGNKVEASLCILDQRASNGVVFQLLWAGVVRWARQLRAEAIVSFPFFERGMESTFFLECLLSYGGKVCGEPLVHPLTSQVSIPVVFQIPPLSA